MRCAVPTCLFGLQGGTQTDREIVLRVRHQHNHNHARVERPASAATGCQLRAQTSCRLDPEQWHQVLDRFFAILTDRIHRFEGTVDQTIGDGIMCSLVHRLRMKNTRDARVTRRTTGAPVPTKFASSTALPSAFVSA